MRLGLVAAIVILLLLVPTLFLAGWMFASKSGAPATSHREPAAVDDSPWPQPYGFRFEIPSDTPTKKPPPLPFDHVQLQRTECYGTCPAYTVTLWRDGHATYSGGRYAPRSGDFAGKVDQLSYGWLCYLLVELRFDQLDHDYSSNWTDLPTAFVRVWREPGDEPITVRDYGVAGPVALWGIERDIDAVCDRIAWTPAH